MNKIEFKRNKKQLSAYFYGEIDSLTAAKYRHLFIGEMEDKQYTHILLDFSHVNFIDSSGIGFVLGRYNDMKKVGGRVYVKGLNPIAYRLFDLTGIFDLVTYIQDEKEILVKAGNQYESNENHI